jgi:hypothetical protein
VGVPWIVAIEGDDEEAGDAEKNRFLACLWRTPRALGVVDNGGMSACALGGSSVSFIFFSPYELTSSDFTFFCDWLLRIILWGNFICYEAKICAKTGAMNAQSLEIERQQMRFARDPPFAQTYGEISLSLFSLRKLLFVGVHRLL